MLLVLLMLVWTASVPVFRHECSMMVVCEDGVPCEEALQSRMVPGEGTEDEECDCCASEETTGSSELPSGIQTTGLAAVPCCSNVDIIPQSNTAYLVTVPVTGAVVLEHDALPELQTPSVSEAWEHQVLFSMYRSGAPPGGDNLILRTSRFLI
jgi:hypothetical protein